uniref:Isoflavone reductase homolog 2 (Fragments) n=1 Tax=Pseudotsuga menziesii TaxID=3357 RepID=IFRH2_PSEMZ|nr:RecName: Full=Isoflavone reductase homolog 2 [Pseudotsuga menziesii]
ILIIGGTGYIGRKVDVVISAVKFLPSEFGNDVDRVVFVKEEDIGTFTIK